MGKRDNEDEYVPSRYKKEDALRDLDSLETPSFLPSSILRQTEEKEKETVIVDSDEAFDYSWLDTLQELRIEKKSFKNLDSLFDGGVKKSKKKKKKKQDGPKDYTEDYQKEISLYQDLLREQTQLTSSLQKRYDQLTNQKSSARGVGKFTTDLITTINQSRSLSKDIIKEIANTKKTIADLNMKEREKFSKNGMLDDADKGQFAAGYLKQIMGANLNGTYGGGEYGIDDVSSGEDFFGDMDDFMRNSEGYVSRSEDAEKYLKYENQKVEIKILYNEETEEKEFIAFNEDDEVIDDYPLPSTIDTVSINRSTMIGVDKFGQKFKVIFC